MSTPAHTLIVDNGKYTFVNRNGWVLDVLRHGEPWVTNLDAPKAVSSMMAELDAARVVLQAARKLGEWFERCPLEIVAALAKHEEPLALVRALAAHGRLCDDNQPPSAWAQP